jgi:hypothetical protein
MKTLAMLPGVIAGLPSPCPLPRAGEGKGREFSLSAQALAQRPRPPLPLAGEGRGEGTLAATLQEWTPGHPQSAPTPHHSRIESREIPRALDQVFARDHRPHSLRGGHHQVRPPSARADTPGPRCSFPRASAGGIDSRPIADSADSARGVVRHRWNPGAERVRSMSVKACARFPSPYPLPQAGEGNTLRSRVTAGRVGNRRP